MPPSVPLDSRATLSGRDESTVKPTDRGVEVQRNVSRPEEGALKPVPCG
jgi:hypothetical protein